MEWIVLLAAPARKSLSRVPAADRKAGGPPLIPRVFDLNRGALLPSTPLRAGPCRFRKGRVQGPTTEENSLMHSRCS